MMSYPSDTCRAEFPLTRTDDGAYCSVDTWALACNEIDRLRELVANAVPLIESLPDVGGAIDGVDGVATARSDNGMSFGPPDMGQRALPQPRRPEPFRSEDYEAGYDAGFIADGPGSSGMNFGPVDPADVRTCPLCGHDMAPNGDGCVCDLPATPEQVAWVRAQRRTA